eukprot:scaffold15600_cov72-Phaeocystis_antarctica.AAC.2
MSSPVITHEASTTEQPQQVSGTKGTHNTRRTRHANHTVVRGRIVASGGQSPRWVAPAAKDIAQTDRQTDRQSGRKTHSSLLK